MKTAAEELKNGREIVVISPNKDDDSGIFWMDDNIIYTFSRHMGTFPRTAEEYSLQQFQAHIKRMTKEGAHIFARGIR